MISQHQGDEVVKFCTSCGTTLERKEFNRKYRIYCPRCHHIHYPHLKIGVGALIEQDGRLLLIQRTQMPFIRCWNLPAGYEEIDEDPHQTVVREVYEETRLCVEVKGLIDIYYFADDPRGNGILIVYKCQPVGGNLTATAEGINPTFFTADEIPKELSGGGHDQAIRAWQKKMLA